MYVDEQAACDAKTCMTDVAGGGGLGSVPIWATDTICMLEQPWTATDGTQVKWFTFYER